MYVCVCMQTVVSIFPIYHIYHTYLSYLSINLSYLFIIPIYHLSYLSLHVSVYVSTYVRMICGVSSGNGGLPSLKRAGGWGPKKGLETQSRIYRPSGM
jgi:hypothetical protein